MGKKTQIKNVQALVCEDVEKRSLSVLHKKHKTEGNFFSQEVCATTQSRLTNTLVKMASFIPDIGGDSFPRTGKSEFTI